MAGIGCQNRPDGHRENLYWDEVNEKFAKQMQAGNVTCRHHIAIAVSGGADSMALCLLAARWKGLSPCNGRTEETCKFGGLLGFVVDHNLRSDSAEEALRVQRWIRNLGMKCEILKCVWVDGPPPLGHLQEAARNARYALLAQACQQAGVQVLLTAHHADDQAELFILRMSRCSGIAGLAGMASAIELHPGLLPSDMKPPIPHSLMLMRPLLKFVKKELYKICQQSGQKWVEDPTNINLIFARNRIRKALHEPPYIGIQKEIQGLIDFSRKARVTLDRDRDQLLSDLVWISQEWGHAVIDVDKLAASGAPDAVVHRVVAALLQFVAQKGMPPRGRAVRNATDHLRSNSTKGAYTVGGCDVFPAPGSKGKKAVICFSPGCPQPSVPIEVFLDQSCRRLSAELVTANYGVSLPLSGSISGEDLISKDFISILETIAMVEYGGVATPCTMLNKFRGLGLISELGASLLDELTSDLSKDMGKQPVKHIKENLNTQVKFAPGESIRKPILLGEYQHFMDRFVVSFSTRALKMSAELLSSEGVTEALPPGYCSLLSERSTFWIRHFEEKDWLYLLSVARGAAGSQRIGGCKFEADVTSKNPQSLCCCQWKGIPPSQYGTQVWKPPTLAPSHPSHESQLGCDHSAAMGYNISGELNKVGSSWRPWCDAQRRLRAKEALEQLRTVPRLVRRGLPVLVTTQGLLLGVPSVRYGHCPLLSVTASFCPRTPLGGGQAAWL